ncbi:MAG TPA: anthranilate phosphoribosyltransferase [Planctomycetota bacterium]|jgi:anthranilate phosphoribosyltransferase|nr:anthranilate phosphoribosyltransferase [Planctomycetota bacterium]OQC20366.1 MAG: Anthranilate phosphoribosyltransferase [Planctomycetes bacterium ADurb.Bin069]HNR98649.1 anthranilate phosphoribosyltransferase [Planctomycetota bacterium]HNU25029.1 anthranilate phosphoribosyltransferase [Planctomycetota bacterium]HOE28487.1 anthranilate phosphoribosyltransferase [Planctomycetota bacterium]
MITDAIKRLVAGAGLSEDESEALLAYIMEGKCTEAQIGAVLALLRRNGETPEEIAGFAKAMRAKALAVPFAGESMDLCGTGGDGKGTINISTAASFVVAACGVTVAKHGNRAATSRSGGADVLERLGLKLEAPPEKLARALEDVGICFLFARVFHPAMRFVAQARIDLGTRTIFNLLGPLTNPAAPRRQLLGVFSPEAARLMAAALCRVGVARAWLVHGAGGVDEVSPAGPTRVWEVEGGRVRERVVAPADFGLPVRALDLIRGGDAARNAEVMRAVLRGEESPAQEAVLMNAAAALFIADRAADLKDGVARAREAVASGAAAAKLARLIEYMAE